MTEQQLQALARLTRDRAANFHVWRTPFDLPVGYINVVFDGGFTCGISPEGEVSS